MDDALLEVLEDGERGEVEDLAIVGRGEAPLAQVRHRLAKLELLLLLGARLRQQRGDLAHHQPEGAGRHLRDDAEAYARRPLPVDERLVEQQLVARQKESVPGQ